MPKQPSENKGLTVRINLWSLEPYVSEFNAEKARLWVKGQAVNEHTGEKKLFNDPGQLITTLGKWNSEQLAKLRATKRGA